MKTLVITLLFAVTAFSPLAPACARTLLSDCSQVASARNVTAITFDEGNVRSETVLRDVETFFCNEFGLFVYQNDNHEWFTGSVHAKENELRIYNIPEGVVSGAVSANGKLIAWAIQAGLESRLELYDVSSRQSVPLTTTSGFIRAPSWSPDDRTIAYYMGTQNALSEDGFVLMKIDITNNAECERLTPPSLLTRLNAARTIPPLWSPDGSRLLFEARYEYSTDQDVHRRSQQQQTASLRMLVMARRQLRMLRLLDFRRFPPRICNAPLCPKNHAGFNRNE